MALTKDFVAMCEDIGFKVKQEEDGTVVFTYKDGTQNSVVNAPSKPSKPVKPSTPPNLCLSQIKCCSVCKFIDRDADIDYFDNVLLCSKYKFPVIEDYICDSFDKLAV